ncbi:MAG TPA: hypothetical protein VEK08_18240 [Planctomycetota bacterium]|nr:hypothetical protein [Planctomycetota bacterium]
MRATWLASFCFVLIACVWAFHLPLEAWIAVQNLAAPESAQLNRQRLLNAGNTAHAALRKALDSSELDHRLAAARVLALRGDQSGERVLFDILHAHSEPDDSLGARAETYLAELWDVRDGPGSAQRERLSRAAGAASDRDMLPVLNELLEKYPGWSGGYLRRAKLYLRNGEGVEARRQALIALAIDEANFEAMVVLAQAYLLLNSPDQSYVCLQQAVRLNPRLRHTLQEEIKETIKSIDLERARRRRERRRDVPVA